MPNFGEWIPASTPPPFTFSSHPLTRYSSAVLVQWSSGGITVAVYRTNISNTKPFWQPLPEPDYYDDGDDSVIAWMPLPAPYDPNTPIK